MPLPPRRSMEELFDTAAARFLNGVGKPCDYISADGEVVKAGIMASRYERSLEVGDYGVTVAQVMAVDVLNADVPDPEQGQQLVFAGPLMLVIDRKAEDDGHITTLIVSQGGGVP